MSLLEAPRSPWRTPLLIASIVAPVVIAGIAVVRALGESTAPAPPASTGTVLFDRFRAMTGVDPSELAALLGADYGKLPEPFPTDEAEIEALRRAHEELRARGVAWVRARLAASGAPAESERYRWLLRAEMLRGPAMKELALCIADLKRLEAVLAARPSPEKSAELSALAAKVEVEMRPLHVLGVVIAALKDDPTTLPHEATDAWVLRVHSTTEAAQTDALRTEGEHLRAALYFYEDRARTAFTEEAVADAHRACIERIDATLEALDAKARLEKKSAWW